MKALGLSAEEIRLRGGGYRGRDQRERLVLLLSSDCDFEACAKLSDAGLLNLGFPRNSEECRNFLATGNRPRGQEVFGGELGFSPGLHPERRLRRETLLSWP